MSGEARRGRLVKYLCCEPPSPRTTVDLHSRSRTAGRNLALAGMMARAHRECTEMYCAPQDGAMMSAKRQSGFLPFNPTLYSKPPTRAPKLREAALPALIVALSAVGGSCAQGKADIVQAAPAEKVGPPPA